MFAPDPHFLRAGEMGAPGAMALVDGMGDEAGRARVTHPFQCCETRVLERQPEPVAGFARGDRDEARAGNLRPPPGEGAG